LPPLGHRGVVRRIKVATVKKQVSLRMLLAITTFIAIFLAAWLWFAPGVKITVYNVGDFPLLDLQVHVTGRSNDLGDIPSGAMKSCIVRPIGDSLVEISYRLPDGTTLRKSAKGFLNSAGGFGAGYSGIMEYKIRDGELVHASFHLGASLR
jgi:hypothetical protein